jgi:ABC-type lipoprotein release transport system permease subunit
MAAGLRITALGVVLGVAGAFAVTRLLQSLLFEVKPTDPVTFTAMTLLLSAIALAACAIPAYRATRVAPQDALVAE